MVIKKLKEGEFAVEFEKPDIFLLLCALGKDTATAKIRTNEIFAKIEDVLS